MKSLEASGRCTMCQDQRQEPLSRPYRALRDQPWLAASCSADNLSMPWIDENGNVTVTPTKRGLVDHQDAAVAPTARRHYQIGPAATMAMMQCQGSP